MRLALLLLALFSELFVGWGFPVRALGFPDDLPRISRNMSTMQTVVEKHQPSRAGDNGHGIYRVGVPKLNRDRGLQVTMCMHHAVGGPSDEAHSRSVS